MNRRLAAPPIAVVLLAGLALGAGEGVIGGAASSYFRQ
jgi:hypothetical protein